MICCKNVVYEEMLNPLIHSIVVFYLLHNEVQSRDTYDYVDLPVEHMPFYFSNYPEIADKCRKDRYCPYKISLDRDVCWGYEGINCTRMKYYSYPECPGHHKGWVKTKQEQMELFYNQVDFGYMAERMQEMMVICEPLFPDDSSLLCSKYLQFCKGRNIMIDFRELANRTDPIRYKMDVLKHGQIGGYCRLHSERLKNESERMSPLQSWAPEIQHFVSFPKRSADWCDLVVEKPTFIMKIDATVNMYHHFCDFFNLYASLHLNSTHSHTFSRNVHVLIWETYSYASNFGVTWKAFTEYPIWDLKQFSGKKVCFKNVVFPLLPRMIFGLFYNTPIVWGCEKSGLFHAFSKHILHRLRIPPRANTTRDKIYITLLSRDTKYRRIINEGELLRALENNNSYSVRRVVYTHHMDFKEQLEITHHTDVFIGVHGSGLTHLLFLPDWGVLFELYNCEDSGCYSDLARLRGVKYLTWEDKTKLIQEDEGHHPEGGAHAKFTNYAFDVTEFLRLVETATNHVRQHRAFQNQQQNHDEL